MYSFCLSISIYFSPSVHSCPRLRNDRVIVGFLTINWWLSPCMPHPDCYSAVSASRARPTRPAPISAIIPPKNKLSLETTNGEENCARCVQQSLSPPEKRSTRKPPTRETDPEISHNSTYENQEDTESTRRILDEIKEIETNKKDRSTSWCQVVRKPVIEQCSSGSTSIDLATMLKPPEKHVNKGTGHTCKK